VESLAVTDWSSSLPDPSFWRAKRVLVTGHTGFKGGWLTLWLARMGANVTGIGLEPNTCPNLFELADLRSLGSSHFCDVRDAESLTKIVRNAQPEVVFHLAAQALVRASYRAPLDTFATNVMGTAHILDALRGIGSVRAAIMVTTDKVYRNNEWPWPYRETDILGGHDPYSASKAASELVIDCYRGAFLGEQGVAVASARAGNVIGGGDWSEDRLVPDAIRAWQAGRTLQIRHPGSTRPWQYVLEPLAGYLLLGQRLFDDSSLSGPYNFGPLASNVATVRDVVDLACESYGYGDVLYSSVDDGPVEASRLELDISKAWKAVGFRSRYSLSQAIQSTIGWYKAQHAGTDARELCEHCIVAYEDER